MNNWGKLPMFIDMHRLGKFPRHDQDCAVCLNRRDSELEKSAWQVILVGNNRIKADVAYHTNIYSRSQNEVEAVILLKSAETEQVPIYCR